MMVTLLLPVKQSNQKDDQMIRMHTCIMISLVGLTFVYYRKAMNNKQTLKK